MRNSLPYRLVACWVIVVLVSASIPAHAEGPARSLDELRHEAFLRGGTAITEALNHATTAEPLVSSAIAESIPPRRPMPPQAVEKKSRSVLLWVGIAIGAAISAYLIQRSVTKHRRIFAPGV